MSAHTTKHVDELRRANKAFQELADTVTKAVDDGTDEFDLHEMGRIVGINLDEKVLAHLDLPPKLLAHPFLPWQEWFPWRQFWLLYWGEEAPRSTLGRAASVFERTEGPGAPVRIDLENAFLPCPPMP